MVCLPQLSSLTMLIVSDSRIRFLIDIFPNIGKPFHLNLSNLELYANMIYKPDLYVVSLSKVT